MTSNGDNLPRPDPIWIALAIVVWAIAEALDDGRGRRFVEALERRSAEQDTVRRIVPLSQASERRANLSRSARIARTWLSRLSVALRAAER